MHYLCSIYRTVAMLASWLIHWRPASSISAIFRVRTSSIIYKNYIEIWRDGSTGSTNLDGHWKSMESCVGTKKLVFCNAYNALTLFQNRSLACRERGTLQTCYPVWSNMTTPTERTPPIHHLRNRKEALWVWAQHPTKEFINKVF